MLVSSVCHGHQVHTKVLLEELIQKVLVSIVVLLPAIVFPSSLAIHHTHDHMDMRMTSIFMNSVDDLVLASIEADGILSYPV